MPAYIELFHGRTDPKEELEDWGSPGPIFGPLQFVHTTYACHIKFNYADVLKFEMPDAQSPQKTGTGSDPRPRALNVEWIEFVPE
jgi:hypothetical protein